MRASLAFSIVFIGWQIDYNGRSIVFFRINMILINKLITLPRNSKRFIGLLIDTLFISVAYWCSIFVRLDSIEPLTTLSYWNALFIVWFVSIIAFVRLGLYRAVLRYMSVEALLAVMFGVFISVFMLYIASYITNVDIPRTVPIVYLCFCLLLVGGSRVIFRALFGKIQTRFKEPVIIYGAGSAGCQLAKALNDGPEYQVVSFIDDDPKKQGTSILGVLVRKIDSLQSEIDTKRVKKVLLALPSLNHSQRQKIINKLEPYAVKVKTIPGMAEMIDQKMDLGHVKDIAIEDLLGRDPVAPKKDLIGANISELNVMVTGAGGSIGSELCRQIIKLNPKSVVLFELSEFALYVIEKELSEYLNNNEQIKIIPIIGSVQDKNKVKSVIKSFSVDTIYHAAAYKHVPMVEHNVIEGVKNNIFGTLTVSEAAVECGVATFVLISTDKAVRPTNIMGTTKRMAELVLQALNLKQSSTRFCMVRFGNVLGSSGSVVPLFRKQIKLGGPITLTHPDITRFFMTIPEAAQLVLQAGAMGEGGDVFVLDMGESVKIRDLAVKLVHLSGLELKSSSHPEGDIEIKCTGLRPGEKLYEELLIGDNVITTKHERIMAAQELSLEWSELSIILNALHAACENFDLPLIREILLSAPTSYQPTDEICDLIWLAQSKSESLTLVS